MRTHINLILQLATVVGIVALRVLTPGLVFVLFFIFIPIGTLALVVHIVLAASVLRRGRLDLGVSAGFLLLAASGLGVAALMPEVSDGPGDGLSPLAVLTGHGLVNSWQIAIYLLILWFVTAIAVAVGAAATHRPAPPPVPMPVYAPIPHTR